MPMKGIFTVLLLITSLSSCSQSDKIIGEYLREFGDEKHRVERKLKLNQDGTFAFHSYSNINAGIPQIVHKYGKGTWSVDDKVVSFFTDNEKDMDIKTP